jgi:hypothetical protein
MLTLCQHAIVLGFLAEILKILTAPQIFAVITLNGCQKILQKERFLMKKSGKN